MSTAQEVFDKVAKHLLTQNEKSLGRSGICQYRNYKGLQCAVGVLIPEEKYRPEFEGWDVVALMSRYGPIVPEMADHKGLLRLLQGVHDDSAVSRWPDQLRDVAKQFKLDPKVIDEHTADR